MKPTPNARARRPWRTCLGLLPALAFMAMVLAGPPARAAEAIAYVARIDDLPLMPGLAEIADAGISFDKPSGRIVEAYARGAVARAAVSAFYGRTLPQLGWRARAGQANVFVREDERLGLDYLGEDGDLIVRFTLEPN